MCDVRVPGDWMTSVEMTHRNYNVLDEVLVLPNFAMLGFFVIFALVSMASRARVEPLVVVDSKTAARIAELERVASHAAAGGASAAIELAGLYRRAGEFPWSYDALRSAERSGPTDPAWRLELGIAYLQLGSNTDAHRVFKRAQEACDLRQCAVPVRARLGIFANIAQTLEANNIDGRYDQVRAHKALKTVLKPIAGRGGAAE